MSDSVSFDAFMANPALYLTPPALPAKGALVAWAKKRLEHGVAVTSGVSEAHRILDGPKTLCLIRVPSVEQVIPTAGVKPCRRCEALHRLGVTTLEEAATLAARSVA